MSRHDFSATGANCWCDPYLLTVCDNCYGQESECWKCQGEGLIPWDGVSTDTVTVRHRYEEDG